MVAGMTLQQVDEAVASLGKAVEQAEQCLRQLRPLTGSPPAPRSLAEIEREAILACLQFFGGNKQEAARALGIGRQTLYNKLAQYAQEKNERDCVSVVRTDPFRPLLTPS